MRLEFYDHFHSRLCTLHEGVYRLPPATNALIFGIGELGTPPSAKLLQNLARRGQATTLHVITVNDLTIQGHLKNASVPFLQNHFEAGLLCDNRRQTGSVLEEASLQAVCDSNDLLCFAHFGSPPYYHVICSLPFQTG